MSKLTLGAFFFLVLLFFAIFTSSFEYISIADSDNETSVENATRNAMTQAINLGNARVNEEISINEDIAVEAIVRQYAESSDFFEGERYVNIYRISERAPMIAVDSYTVINTPFNDMASRITKKPASNESITRSREIVIYESKALTK
ncbi:DUF5411 family protein [Bacillaceae bacterium CLA-AA-H227]|uniref:DUF5411 family protein n=1 Tax=Robertmurraya yapensis (ex Hitch et al 2024) TaxID=3133160 RepID=A0ACC6SGE4_9BACI